MKMLLIDDMRSVEEAVNIAKQRYSDGNVTDLATVTDIARTLDEAMLKLEDNRYSILLVDHDLGESDTCGADALKYLIDRYFDVGSALPRYVFAVSSNPAGIKKINGYKEDIIRLREIKYGDNL